MIALATTLMFAMLPRAQPHAGRGETPQMRSIVLRYASHYHLPPEFVSAIIDQESGWDPKALSYTGAMGITQLMPVTASRFGAMHPYDPEENIAACTRYLTLLMWEFHGDLRLVSAAYNAGDKWICKRQLDYRNPEVVAYVESVRAHYIKRLRATATYPRRNP